MLESRLRQLKQLAKENRERGTIPRIAYAKGIEDAVKEIENILKQEQKNG